MILHPLALMAIAALLGLIAGGWQWTDRGLTETVVTVPATALQTERTRFTPEWVKRTDHTYQYTCPEGHYPGVQAMFGAVSGPVSVPEPETPPEFVACFRQHDARAAVTTTEFRGPVLGDLQIVAVVGVGVI